MYELLSATDRNLSQAGRTRSGTILLDRVTPRTTVVTDDSNACEMRAAIMGDVHRATQR
jgi:hypothetical protein